MEFSPHLGHFSETRRATPRTSSPRARARLSTHCENSLATFRSPGRPVCGCVGKSGHGRHQRARMNAARITRGARTISCSGSRSYRRPNDLNIILILRTGKVATVVAASISYRTRDLPSRPVESRRQSWMKLSKISMHVIETLRFTCQVHSRISLLRTSPQA